VRLRSRPSLPRGDSCLVGAGGTRPQPFPYPT
jgi:hypothetical protein